MIHGLRYVCYHRGGQVYALSGLTRPILLGRISSLVSEGTPLGRKVRAWWQARLASEDPGENIALTRSGEFHFVRSGEVIIAEEEDEQLPPAQMAAN